MARNSDATNGELTHKQAEHVQKVDTIRVDADDIVNHLEKNLRLQETTYTGRKFRVEGIRSGSPCSVGAKVDPRDEGAHYDSKPHPIWISPKQFVEGYGRDEDARRPNYPTRHEQASIVRTDHPNLDEGSDEFEELVDEYHEVALEHWESEVRHRLKDEIEFSFRAVQHHPEYKDRTITHTVSVEYEE